MEGLTVLKGIGRKSANVIMREAGVSSEGIIADLHVIRVTPRIGLIPETQDGNKVENNSCRSYQKTFGEKLAWRFHFLEEKFAEQSQNVRNVQFIGFVSITELISRIYNSI
ncbi:HhH-GDP family DNA glycosylase [Flavobacterium laiguense]|uniref:hypothetical protein n=1 Tax=Flavobacterium laiguense TaxID=2169409 RepID=UPI001CB8BF48|nr:hypothetical protein [Flavobacterium laiguense]